MSKRPLSHERVAVKTSDERTALLSVVEPEPLEQANDSSPNVTNGNGSEIESDEEEVETVPLPKAQVFLLCFTSVVAPTAFFSIFPYINFMIEKVGNVNKEDVGFYSGLIESLFSATQMCVMIFWGKARSYSLGSIECESRKLTITGF